MIPKPTPKIAQHPTIKATGAKGYLLWLASDPQMAKIYNAIRPQLIALISSDQLPAGPGSGGLSGGQTHDFAREYAHSMHESLSGFGACCYGACCFATSNAVCVSAPAANDIVTQQAPSSGSASSSWLSTIEGLVSTAGTAYAAVSNATIAAQANSIQLQRAKAGQAPLNLSSYGISTTPGLNLGLSSSTLGTIVVVAGIGLIAVFALSGRKHRA